MPNPTIVTATENNAAIASGTSVTVSSTGSVGAGNLMIVVLVVSGASVQPTSLAPPAGWSTLMATQALVSGGLFAGAIFYKQNGAAGSFSGSFTWTTTATNGRWAFMEWSGAGAGLIDGAVAKTQNAAGTQTSPTKTPGTGNVNDTLICMLLEGASSGTETVTIPAGMTAISCMSTQQSSGVSFFLGASLALASASATGAKTWTITGTSHANLGVSFLIQQAVPFGFEDDFDMTAEQIVCEANRVTMLGYQ